MSDVRQAVADGAPLLPKEILSLSFDPSWADGDPEGRPYIVVDLADQEELSRDEAERVRGWLTSQPVPVIGLGDPAARPLAQAADLLVTTDAELERALRAVARNPGAAAVLVQVLRAVGALSIEQGLTLESLAYATLQGGHEFARWLAGRRQEHSPRAGPEAEAPLLMRRDGDRLAILLNSPETRNALSVAMRDALTDAFRLVAMDDSIAGVEVSANGPCFSAGGDLSEFGTAPDPAEAHRIRMLRMPARYLAARAERYCFRLHRACIGAGIELPAFAGRLVATPNTFFQLPELAMGLIPGAGGCVSITRRIGRQRTAYLSILGKKIGAERALEWGLIDAIED